MKQRDQAAIGLGLLALLFLWSRKGSGAATLPGTPTGPGTDTLPGKPKGDGSGDLRGLEGAGQLPDVAKPSDYGKVVDPWIASKPTPGKFYRVRMGDNWTSVAKRALQGSGEPYVPYIRAMNLPRWNQELYATPWDPENPKIPEYTAADGENGKIVISKAFLPRHQNAAFLLRQGQSPARTILFDTNGTPVSPGSSYGLLWLPSEDYPDPPLAIRSIANEVYG